MPRSQPPSLFDRITSWLDSIFNPKKPEAQPKEIVRRQIEVKVENPGDRRNLVEEIEDPEELALTTFRVRPIHHKHTKNKSGTSATPNSSTLGEVSHYFFIHKIPHRLRGKPISVMAAGRRYLMTDTSLELGYHRVSVLRIPDKQNKATWFYPYKKGFLFNGDDGGDRFALRFAEIFAKRLVVSDLTSFKFGEQIERVVESAGLGTWKERELEREERRRSVDPFSRG